MTASTLLHVRNLTVRHPGGAEALRGLSLDLARGERLAVLGESGSGKSSLALCLAGLVQPPVAGGSVKLDGHELLGTPESKLRSLRWDRVALLLQGTPFTPVFTLGDQIAEPLRQRRSLRAREARERAAELAREVLLDPDLLDRFPHEVSGGQRRRAALAAALTLDPELLVLDEPTAGLDAATAAGLVAQLRDLATRRELAVVLITHSLADAARLAARSVVLYGGQIMEEGPTDVVLGQPAHPYTWALTAAYPVLSSTRDLRPIRGRSPDARALPSGCPFHPRCPQADDHCRTEPVSLAPVGDRQVACHFGGLRTLLDVRGISHAFGTRRRAHQALTDVAFALREGEALGVVGASGSGKSTLARVISGHLRAQTGEVLVAGGPLGSDRRQRARVQLVMQDPWEALSPRFTVAELVREPLDVSGDLEVADRDRQVAAALADVGLPDSADFLAVRSHELSGGQLQRVALARALVARPRLLVADEPTSMLDPSEQARLMVVLRERQSELGLGLVLISHDLALVRKATDRLLVMDEGRIVETGRTETICAQPRSKAVRRLLDASPALFPVPTPDLIPATAWQDPSEGDIR